MTDLEITKTKKSKEYLAGYDAGMNGATTANCHFSLFSTPEKTKEWERGNDDGSYAREQKRKVTP